MKRTLLGIYPEVAFVCLQETGHDSASSHFYTSRIDGQADGTFERPDQ